MILRNQLGEGEAQDNGTGLLERERERESTKITTTMAIFRDCMHDSKSSAYVGSLNFSNYPIR